MQYKKLHLTYIACSQFLLQNRGEDHRKLGSKGQALLLTTMQKWSSTLGAQGKKHKAAEERGSKLDVVQLSYSSLESKKQNKQKASTDETCSENLKEDLIFSFGQVLKLWYTYGSSLKIVWVVGKWEPPRKTKFHSRTLCWAHSLRSLLHTSGTEQRFHTNYTGLAAFVTGYATLSRKEKRKTIWTLMLTKKEKVDVGTRTKDGIGLTASQHMCTMNYNLK